MKGGEEEKTKKTKKKKSHLHAASPLPPGSGGLASQLCRDFCTPKFANTHPDFAHLAYTLYTTL